MAVVKKESLKKIGLRKYKGKRDWLVTVILPRSGLLEQVNPADPESSWRVFLFSLGAGRLITSFGRRTMRYGNT